MKYTIKVGSFFTAMALMVSTMAAPSIGVETAQVDEFLRGYLYSLSEPYDPDHDHGEGAHLPDLFLLSEDNELWTVQYDSADADQIAESIQHYVTLYGTIIEDSASAKTVDLERVFQYTPDGTTAVEAEGNEAINYAILKCEFSDNVGTILDTDFSTFFGTTFPGLNHYYDTISYDNQEITADDLGVFTLPYPASRYTPDPEDEFANALLFRDDCLIEVMETEDLSSYNGILLLPSSAFDGWLGLGSIGSSFTEINGEVLEYFTVWAQPNGFDHLTFAHEIGHNVGWYHSVDADGFVYSSEWDVMSTGGTTDVNYPAFGEIASDTIALNKIGSQWIPENKVYQYSGYGTETVTLEAHAKDSASWDQNAYLAVAFETQSGTAYGGARFVDGYDAGVPGAGVVIHDFSVFNVFAGVGGILVDQTDNGDPNDEGSYLVVGESYTDPNTNITVEVLSVDTSNRSFDLQFSSPNPTVQLEELPKNLFDADNETVPFEATASDEQGTVDLVEIRVRTKSDFGREYEEFFELTEAPFTLDWDPITPQQYEAQARAVDNDGNESFSNTIEFTVSQDLNYWTLWERTGFEFTGLPPVLQEHDGQLYQAYVDQNGRIWTRSSSSTDPENMTWSEFATSPDLFEFTDRAISMASSNGVLYQTHVGGAGQIWTRNSTDGVNWSGWTRDETDPFEFTALPVYQADNNGVLYQTHVGGSNTIWTRNSTDGINWSGWTRDETDLFEFTQYPVTIASDGTNIYQVHVGGTNQIWTRNSTDGENWTQWQRGNDPLEDTRSTVAIVYTNNTLVQAHTGLSDQVFTRFSFDNGATWSTWNEHETSFDAFNSIGMTAYDGTVWQAANEFGVMYIRKYLGSFED